MNIAISVIIPVYNAEKTIYRAVSSVLDKNFNNFEIIAIDDGSTDNSLKILKDLEKQNVQLKVYHQKNKGVSKTRNYGISIAKGKYIFFLDSDDFLDHGTIKKMYEFGIKYKLDLIACNYTENNATITEPHNMTETEKYISSRSEISNIFDVLFIHSACAKLYKSEILKKHDIKFDIDMSLGEDFYFSLQYLMLVNRIGYIGSAYYRIDNINSHSLSKKYTHNLEDSLNMQYECWKKFVKCTPNIEEQYRKYHMNMGVYLMTIYFSNLFKFDAPKISPKKKLKLIKIFMNNHCLWINSGKGHPQSFAQKIMAKTILSKNIYKIFLLFYVKEKIRRYKFYLGKLIGKI